MTPELEKLKGDLARATLDTQRAYDAVGAYMRNCPHVWRREKLIAPAEEYRTGRSIHKFTCALCGMEEVTR